MVVVGIVLVVLYLRVLFRFASYHLTKAAWEYVSVGGGGGGEEVATSFTFVVQNS